jgi:hypothetical protein
MKHEIWSINWQKQRLMMELYICNDVAIGCFHRFQSPCHINSSIIQNRLYMKNTLCERPKFSIEHYLKNAFSYVKMFIQSNTRRYLSWSTCTTLVYNITPHQMVLILPSYQVLNYFMELDFGLKFRSSNWFWPIKELFLTFNWGFLIQRTRSKN